MIPIELAAGTYSSGIWLPEIRLATLGLRLSIAASSQGHAGPLDAVYRSSLCLSPGADLHMEARGSLCRHAKVKGIEAVIVDGMLAAWLARGLRR